MCAQSVDRHDCEVSTTTMQGPTALKHPSEEAVIQLSVIVISDNLHTELKQPYFI